MANYVKTKIGIAVFSVSMLILVPMLETNFNKPIIIKRWGQLSWRDFQGLPRPFTSYAAGISSRVYLEYDSSINEYTAFAGQHNVRSWTNDSGVYALNHEQYHFNITEVHARMLNAYIKANPDNRKYFYDLRLKTTLSDALGMQDAYDKETHHSLIRDKQRRWEYKIDSMLTVYSADSGAVRDNYSGAKIYFPIKPTFESGHVAGGVFRNYFLSKYDMILSLTSFQYESVDVANLERSLYQFYQDQVLTVKNFKADYAQFPFKATVMAKDSLKNTLLNVWIYDDHYMFKLTAAYPTNAADTTGYFQIASSFLNSFAIENTDPYWLENLEEIKAPEISNHSRQEEISDNINVSDCLAYKAEQQYGFYRGPMYRDDGSLVLAYDVIDPTGSTDFKDALLIDQHQNNYKSDSLHLFVVPYKKIPAEIYSLKLGYISAGEAKKECFTYYYQTLEINPYKEQKMVLAKARAMD